MAGQMLKKQTNEARRLLEQWQEKTERRRVSGKRNTLDFLVDKKS